MSHQSVVCAQNLKREKGCFPFEFLRVFLRPWLRRAHLQLQFLLEWYKIAKKNQETNRNIHKCWISFEQIQECITVCVFYWETITVDCASPNQISCGSSSVIGLSLDLRILKAHRHRHQSWSDFFKARMVTPGSFVICASRGNFSINSRENVKVVDSIGVK